MKFAHELDYDTAMEILKKYYNVVTASIFDILAGIDEHQPTMSCDELKTRLEKYEFMDLLNEIHPNNIIRSMPFEQAKEALKHVLTDLILTINIRKKTGIENNGWLALLSLLNEISQRLLSDAYN